MAGTADWLFAFLAVALFVFRIVSYTYAASRTFSNPLIYSGCSGTYWESPPSVSAVGRDNPALEWDRASIRQMRFSRKALTSIGFPYRITWPNPDDWNLARWETDRGDRFASITAAQCAMSTVQFRSEGCDKRNGYTVMIRQLACFVDSIRISREN